MDHYIWEEACKTIRAWMDEGLEPIPISVNVSRRHLLGTQFIQVLDYLIDKYQIPKSYLELEITESTEAENVNDSIRLLKSRGYTLLMDDFGSGYSSLNMLKDTQFDIIKIDRGFLQNLIGSDRGRSIVEHTIQMTKDIGLDTIAEGVETREEADFLSQCGCDKAQGFYYARPVCLELFNNRYRSEMIKN
jgi:EAL domain-containing protein (putative c-di-GMP-specific phosphodiesterase class I)